MNAQQARSLLELIADLYTLATSESAKEQVDRNVTNEEDSN